MADETTVETATPETPTHNGEPAAEPNPQPSPAQEIDWKAKAREWEQRAKANKTAADELAALKEAQKSDAEKAAEHLAKLEAQVKEFETREQVAGWKAEVSKATGIPAVALAGSTLEEIQAHAETLKSLIPAPARGPVVPTEGTTTGATKVAQLTLADLKGMTPDQINAARSEGRLNDLMGIKP